MRAIKIGATGILATGLLGGLVASQANAGTNINRLTPSQFISSCEQMGGRATRIGEGTIKCTLPSGTEVTCSFVAGGDTICTWKGDISTTTRKQLLGDPAPAQINPNTGTKQPKAPTPPGSSDTVN